MDASIHLWFGNHKVTLHIAVDDATGMIIGAYFVEQKTLHGYYEITKQFLEKYGIPVQILTDNRTVLIIKKMVNHQKKETLSHNIVLCVIVLVLP